MNKRKRVGEWGVVSTSEQLLEVLRIGEEEKQAKKQKMTTKKLIKKIKQIKPLKITVKTKTLPIFLIKRHKKYRF